MGKFFFLTDLRFNNNGITSNSAASKENEKDGDVVKLEKIFNRTKIEKCTKWSNNSRNKKRHFKRRKPKLYNPDEVETDSNVLARREKQLEYLRRTDDYKIYLEMVPKQQRTNSMPNTPDMNRKFSRRHRDGNVKKWKIDVHKVASDQVKQASVSNAIVDEFSKDNAIHNKSSPAFYV